MIVLWFLASRLFSFICYGPAAFGYDTGIYRHFVNGYFERFFDPTIVPFGFSGYTNSLRFLGAGTDTIIFGGYIFLSLLLAVLFYFIVLEYSQKKSVAWFSFVLFSFSIVQYEFFWGYYYRNFLALFFTLVIFYLIQIRSKLLFLPLSALAIIHSLTALPVAVSLVIYALFKKEDRKFILISGLVATACALVLNAREFAVYLPFFTKYFGMATEAVSAGNTEATGIFMGGKNFLYAILWYAPLTIFAFATFQWKKYILPIIFLITNLSLVLGRVVFYQRFLVSIDLIIIIFAGVGLGVLWDSAYKKIKIGIIVFIALFGSYSSWYIFNKKPLLSENEMYGIKTILVEENARIMTVNPYYAPWLYGFTEYGIIAPGMFEHDVWNREKWDLFRAADTAKQNEMLKEYQSQPLYIYMGERDKYFEPKLQENQNLKKINNYVWQVF